MEKPQNTAPGSPGQELGNRELEKREADRGQKRSQTINPKLNLEPKKTRQDKTRLN